MSAPKKAVDGLKEAGRWSAEEHQRFMAGMLYFDYSHCYLWQRLEKSIRNSRNSIWLPSPIACSKVLQQTAQVVKPKGLELTTRQEKGRSFGIKLILRKRKFICKIFAFRWWVERYSNLDRIPDKERVLEQHRKYLFAEIEIIDIKNFKKKL